jgi:hypothetical protein
MSIRDWVKKTWVNKSLAVTGDPQLNATNMNLYDTKINELDKGGKPIDDLPFLLEYFYTKNTKELYTSTTPVTTLYNSWSTTGCTVATASGFLHANGFKVTEADNTASNVNCYRTIDRNYFDKFYSNDTSTTNDYIDLMVYISDVTKVDVTSGAGIMVSLGIDASNRFRAFFNTQGNGDALATGWNRIYTKKSSFVDNGTSNWDNITWCQFGWVSLANASGVNVEFHSCRLVRTNTAGTAQDDKQISLNNGATWSSRMGVNDWNYMIFKDLKTEVNALAICSVGQGTPIKAGLQMTSVAYQDCYCYTKLINKFAGYTLNIGWQANATNYIYWYVAANLLTVLVVIAGTPTVYEATLKTNISAFETIYFKFVKYGTTFKLKYSTSTLVTDCLYITGSCVGLESLSGHIYTGAVTASQRCAMTDFSVSQHNLYY